MSANILDVPSEVVLDYLLPALRLNDIASLSAVNKHFHALASDETFWRLKTGRDFTFAPTSLAPTTDKGWWKTVYLGLRRPRAFLWGSGDHGRLGGAQLSEGVRRFARFVDTPAELAWDSGEETGRGEGRTWGVALRDSIASIAGKGNESDLIEQGEERQGQKAGLVDLQASGWGFAARDFDGGVWVWGQLDGSVTRFRASSWEDKHCQCPEPTRVPLPCQAEAISTGRNHMLVLDSDNLIWELRAWGKAYHHTAPALTAPANYGTTRHPPYVVQLTTGWNHSGCLTSDGAIHVWYPFTEAYEAGLTSDEELNGPLGVREEGDLSRALKWGKVGNDVVTTLPEIPLRPFPPADGQGGDAGEKVSESECAWREYESTRTAKTLRDEQKVVRVASGLEYLIALKGNGEVWFVRLTQQRSFEWIFLRHFSSPSINHITATFSNIASYATPTSFSPKSTVNLGRLPTIPNAREDSRILGEEFTPEHLSALQGKGVIQVVLGDYHFAALTSGGKLYTWGQGNAGQLGRGGDRAGGEPTRVRFPHEDNQGEVEAGEQSGKEKEGKRAFVFAIAAAGWHTGALVLADPKRTKPKIPAPTSHNERTEAESVRDSASGSGGRGTMPGSFPAAGGAQLPFRPIGRGRGTRGGGAVRAQPIFRVGYPGRGMHIGAGRGRGMSGADTGSDNNAGEGSSASGANAGNAGLTRDNDDNDNDNDNNNDDDHGHHNETQANVSVPVLAVGRRGFGHGTNRAPDAGPI